MERELKDDREGQTSTNQKPITKPTKERTPTPESTPPSSPSQIRVSSSEDELVDNECDSAGTYVHFNIRAYENMYKKLIMEEYYAVDYIDTYYVGRITNLSKCKVTCKFLTRQPNDMYKWRVRDDVADIEHKWIFAGPLKLSGTVPFKICGLQAAHKSFREYMKNKK